MEPSDHCHHARNQFYPGKTTEEKLREQLAEKERLLRAESERAATNYAARVKAETEAKKLKRRASGGVCPCCNRTFQQVTRHMKAKHPEFVSEQVPK